MGTTPAPAAAGAIDAAGVIDTAALVALATRLVNAGGENPGGTEQATVDVLVAEAERHGLQVETTEVAPGRPNVLITLPATAAAAGAEPNLHGGEGLLFLGHSDVVPAGEGWSHAPFDARVSGGRLYGRGSTDMKGGLAAVLTAMVALKESGTALGGPVTLACTVDEEELGTGIRALVESGLPHRYLGCVVAEPTDLETVVACRGDAYLEIDVTGRAAHSGRPSDGRSAIDAAVAICNLLAADQERLAAHPDPQLGHGTWNVGLIGGGRGTSIVAPNAHLSLDRRLMPGEDPVSLREQLLAGIEAAGITGDGIGVSARVTMQMPGFRTPQDHPLVRSAVRAVEGAGARTRITSWSAACDGGYVARDFGIPAIVLGPGGINDQAHQVDESVGLDELQAAAHAYVGLARALLQPQTEHNPPAGPVPRTTEGDPS